jgi:hypothetical protein
MFANGYIKIKKIAMKNTHDNYNAAILNDRNDITCHKVPVQQYVNDYIPVIWIKWTENFRFQSDTTLFSTLKSSSNKKHQHYTAQQMQLNSPYNGRQLNLCSCIS